MIPSFLWCDFTEHKAQIKGSLQFIIKLLGKIGNPWGILMSFKICQVCLTVLDSLCNNVCYKQIEGLPSLAWQKWCSPSIKKLQVSRISFSGLLLLGEPKACSFLLNSVFPLCVLSLILTPTLLNYFRSIQSFLAGQVLMKCWFNIFSKCISCGKSSFTVTECVFSETGQRNS